VKIDMAADSANEKSSSSSYPSAASGWYVVVVLTFAYVVSFLDRQLLALLVEPIRADLGLSDTQMGLLLGAAFAIFYTLLGLPIGRLADRYSRRAIIATGVTIWCFMTAACGLAKNFPQLFLARVGVGVGEATLNPSALSMISDYFPRERRGRAISFYNMGVSIGAGVAMILGGWVIAAVSDMPPVILPLAGEVRPWQLAFFVVGLPGLVIALLMTTIREPARQDKILITGRDGTPTEQISIPDTLRYLGQRWRTYGTHFLGMSVVTIIGYGFFFWIPTMFIRTWDWTIPEIGLAYGLVNLVFGPIGVNLAGWIADRLYIRGYKDAHMRTTFIFSLLFVPTAVLTPLMPSGEWAIALLIPASIGAAGITATGVAALMMITPNQLRAQTTALYYFVINVLGLTLGGAAVGIVTDQVFGDPLALRYSLAVVSVCAGLLANGFLFANIKLYRSAVEEAELWSSRN
jgi:MFS family permease